MAHGLSETQSIVYAQGEALLVMPMVTVKFIRSLPNDNKMSDSKICENLRLGSVCPLRFVPLSAP